MTHNDVYIARCSKVRSSPSKVGLVAGLIRGCDAQKAIYYLKFCHKKVARSLSKILYSAVSNAENNFGVDIDNLYVYEVLVGKSITLRRFRARAKGRAARILKRYSNVTVKLKKRVGE